jgi:hypothetical protein
MTTTTTTTSPEKERNFVVHVSVYGKVQAGLTPTSGGQERRRKSGLLVLPELGCLATYIGYISRVSIYLC